MEMQMGGLRLIVPDAERRAWLKALIEENNPAMSVAAIGADFDAACAPPGGCEVFIVDLAYPRAARPQFWAALRVFYPGARVGALVDDLGNKDLIGTALHAGAYCMVGWWESPERIYRAIRGLYSHQGFIPLGPVLDSITDFFGRESLPCPPFCIGRLAIDSTRRTVVRDGTEVKLSPLEFDLLLYLATHVGRAIALPELVQAVWKQPVNTTHLTSQVKYAILRLRRKIEPTPRKPRYILSKRSLGYWMPANPSPDL